MYEFPEPAHRTISEAGRSASLNIEFGRAMEAAYELPERLPQTSAEPGQPPRSFFLHSDPRPLPPQARMFPDAGTDEDGLVPIAA